MARGRFSFALRLLAIFSTDAREQTSLTNWPEDELIAQHLRTAFSKDELERFNYSDPAVYGDILDLWDARIIAGIKKALFD